MIKKKEVFRLKRALRFIPLALGFLFFLSYTFGLEYEKKEPSILKSIHFQKLERTLEVSVAIDGEFIYQLAELSGPLRLVIDLSPVNQILCPPTTDVHDFGILRIRTAIFQPFIARVVFDFQDQLPNYQVSRTEEGLKVTLEKVLKSGAMQAPAEERMPPVAKEKVSELPGRVKVVPENFFNSTIGFSLGSYRISDERYQEVYPGSDGIYGLSLSRVIFSSQRLDFDISLEARTFSRRGASTVTQQESKFTLTPLSAAARCLVRTKYVIFFLGMGADYYRYKEESDLYPAPGYVSGSATGGHIQAGIYFVFPKMSSLRAKAYYKLTRVLTTENEIEANLGGQEFGLGLSFGFSIF